jgi:pimeloyl-ACP methyl ester carboxylesterase
MRWLIATLVLAASIATAEAQPAAQPTPQPAGQPLNAEAARSFSDFLNFAPQRAFVVGADGKANWQAGASGPTPAGAIAAAMKRCEQRGPQTCTLHVVNNYTVTHQDWRQLVPARAVDAPDIGRLRPQPYWSMRGPQLATGLIVWSHGYMAGKNATDSAPQSWIGRFTRLGYDLYRFDREWISDWASDATALATAVGKARELGYRRVVLAGQSAGAWVSLAAAMRGAKVDGVISIAAAHHGTVDKMRDTTRARSEWQQVIKGLKPGPAIVVVNFADDAYDVGGRMADAKAAFAASGVTGLVIEDPDGFKGHGAGGESTFARKFGPCIVAFVETRKKQPPCGD